MALNLSNANVNAVGAFRLARLNNGYIRIYSGTQPANADASVGSNTLLAELRFGSPAFGAGTAGVFAANLVTEDAAGDNTGTPSFYRALGSDGSTVEWDGTAGATGCDMNISGLVGGQIIQGAPVSVSGYTHTEPK